MKKLFNYIKLMLAGRSGKPNTKLHLAIVFAVAAVVGLFVPSVDSVKYNYFLLALLGLVGSSNIDNWSTSKIEIIKNETSTKETKKETKIAADVDDMIKAVKGKE